MHKIALGIAAVALATSPLFQDRAEATTLGTSAGLRVVIDANQPVENVTYYGYGYKRGYHHYKNYGYRPYYRNYSYGY
jgi:hypothetical protein